jgi:hypothetical protein
MKGQFRKGFRQASKLGLRQVQTIKVGNEKIQLVWDNSKDKFIKTESKPAVDIKTIK